MILPQYFLESISSCSGFDEPAFLEAHQQPAATSIRFNPLRSNLAGSSYEEIKLSDVPWCGHGIYLKSRPKFTLDPFLHAGAYYVQEASSMFLFHVVESILPNASGLKLLDLCAAPGGKTSLLASMKQFDFVLANEIISSRVPVLYENLVKWGSSKTYISNNDPKDFNSLGELFDVVLVDAPCSGSGLFRKDPEALAEWNNELVHFCSLRQQRIVKDSLDVLKPGGFLIYSTCSYSVEENESILDYIMEHGGLDSVQLNVPENWNVILSMSDKFSANGYRFYPDKILGEGFFCGVFQKNNSSTNAYPNEHSEQTKLANKQINLDAWVDSSGLTYLDENGELLAVKNDHLSLRSHLKNHLRLRKSGIKLGTLMKKGFVPDHELAMSECVSKKVPQIVLSKADAIKYLRKDDIVVDNYVDGTYLITYQQSPLGWAKIINNRFKNNYPMNWRILMRDE
jgi:16S rRNA C967 or C1407 C5-methylase (RsmB/RsmF family)/NOL1/NOP2/fmu family ribosome biogenesis protein